MCSNIADAIETNTTAHTDMNIILELIELQLGEIAMTIVHKNITADMVAGTGSILYAP